MLKNIVDRLLYKPRKHASRLPFIELADSAILMPSARFVFSCGEKDFSGRIRIGEEAMLNCTFIFESNQGEVQIGERTFINAGTSIISRQRITIGSDVTIAWGCTIYDHNSHSMDWQQRAADIRQQAGDHRAGRNMVHGKNWGAVKSRPIVIEDKAWIGLDCTILNGVTIGEGAIVGAGSVVRDNVEPWTVVAGNPAVLIKRLKQ